MGVANIPDHKDQRTNDEWNALSPMWKMEGAGKGASEDFVTVVSVGTQQASENFVTVLSIGTGKKDDESTQSSPTKHQTNGPTEVYLEEEVEVFRLPGERLGFGLKFEGGNKTSERVRRLFVQSCAEESPASRAQCSWGTLGEGDEVLAIDGVPVTHMTRLDCVRRLKESQLVIRLMVRCRGALRPEVVSAERKASLEKSKIPPELPSAPPPVPPRKLRHPRGSADGEANPSAAKKTWDSSKAQSLSQNNSPSNSQNGSQTNSQNGSQTSSPSSQTSNRPSVGSKSTIYESCESSPKSASASVRESPKGSPKQHSPELTKSKQEPPEAMVYLDARSQCGSTHGSTSDDTGSSLSTVVDRFSTSDRVSTISSASTASTTSEQPGEFSRSDKDFERSSDRDLQLSRAICPFDRFEGDFSSTPPDYLLRRLANSEAVTHVESRGEVERITAVVAPNTVLIEETITFQPPLSFQDAPLSYGHEARPDLFYAADLATDSTTHFRPIKDDAELVGHVNGEHEEFHDVSEASTIVSKLKEVRTEPNSSPPPPPLPARNHVNRISVNQSEISVNQAQSEVQNEQHPRNSEPSSTQSTEKQEESSPLPPPKPLPRKDLKLRRKRPPPPPPPPSAASSQSAQKSQQTSAPTVAPRREVKQENISATDSIVTNENTEVSPFCSSIMNSGSSKEKVDGNGSPERIKINEEYQNLKHTEPEEHPREYEEYKTNKVLEIIEIRKAKAMSPQKTVSISNGKDEVSQESSREKQRNDGFVEEKVKSELSSVQSKPKIIPRNTTISTEVEDSEEEEDCDRVVDRSFETSTCNQIDQSLVRSETFESLREKSSSSMGENPGQRESEDDSTYRSLEDLSEDAKHSETNRGVHREDTIEDDDTTSDESDDGDYYWQSNLATIGEEEETNSLEYTTANKDIPSTEVTPTDDFEPLQSSTMKTDDFNMDGDGHAKIESIQTIEDFPRDESKKHNPETVNGRMENCGGGQRLPPDGDEFPAEYQEFGKNTESNAIEKTNNGDNALGKVEDQYRFLGGSSGTATSMTMTMTMTSTAIATRTATNGGFSRDKHEAFSDKDGLKLVAIESNVITTRSIVLPESRVSLIGQTPVTDTCQEINGKLSSSSAPDNIKSTITNVDTCHVTNTVNRCEDRKTLHISDDVVKKSTPVMNYAAYGSQGNGNVEISEKKIEITGYYQKDVPIMGEVLHREKDNFTDTPPPLPLTGPPKMEAIGTLAKNGNTLEQSPRKFSLNGELWRQDDKSERSVRDKIAMFSSQSSLDAPLFPNTIAVSSNTTNSAKRLSKYKSTEDVCSDEKTPSQREKVSFFAERTQSSFDLTDSGRSSDQDSSAKYAVRASINSMQTSSPFGKSTLPTIHTSKTLPVVSQKPNTSLLPPSLTSEKQSLPRNYSWTPQTDSLQNSLENQGSNGATLKSIPANGLARATSFSGSSTAYGQDRSSTTVDLSSTGSQISRTNSLASTFRRPSDDIRKTSLNQLIEQRRRSISKLRGLVIPEKEAVQIDQPIVDLPEIKSRDFILLHQHPKSNLQDKWGSQSSLASNASATSSSAKVTASFKMPAPQISSKYSPAFKRKSLTVYGSSIPSSTLNTKSKNSSIISTPTITTTNAASAVIDTNLSPSTTSATLTSTPQTYSTEPPKSLESICSPTRSDYSFDFVSASNSPEGLRSKGRIVQRKTRMDYDDSDNDSAVSSSQSSISRGFSPPISPVPSERSTVSSERSYLSTETNYQRRCMISDSSSRTNCRDPSVVDLSVKSNLADKMYLDRSPSSSTSSNSRSPTSVEMNLRNSQIPQRQPIRRSNSTDTNCSTSSTLTSGSQASAESLSRRVLKPQSVEAINRKNILASARCRSGRELNGSPLIQRKFLEEENRCMVNESEEGVHERMNHVYSTEASVTNSQNVKVAYIEVTDSFTDEESFHNVNEHEPKLPPKRSIPQPAARPPKSEMLEPSNDLRMWVRAEAKALEKNKIDRVEQRSRKDSLETDNSFSPSKRNGDGRSMTQSDRKESKVSDSVRSSNSKNNEEQNDLLTILTTKSRSRAAIHVDDGTFGRSKSQMSLEDILCAKSSTKLQRGQSVEEKSDKYGIPSTTDHNKYWTMPSESQSDDKAFVSKIPTFGRTERRLAETSEEMQLETDRTKSTLSKIPTASRYLTRRSASVTDMKKALEKTESANAIVDDRHTTTSSHNRFPSLDSSIDPIEENTITPLSRSHMSHPLDRCVDPRSTTISDNGTSSAEVDRYCSEQFGSISSLASSTSLISQQELAQLVEEANLEDVRSAQDVIVVLLHKENPAGSVGITLAGGSDCEVKEITVHRVLANSVADRDGRVQRGDRILSINGRSTRGLNHRESIAILKQPRSEVVLVVSRARPDEACKLRSRTTSVETIIEGFETNGVPENVAWGPPSVVAVYKDGAGLGFSLEGGRDSPLGDRPLLIKKIFTGGAAEKTGALKAGDQLLEVNGNDVTRMSRIEAWSFMKKLHDGEVNLLVRHPATKSS